MLLHGLWNLSALAGMDGFFEAYATYQVPLFLAFIAFLVWLRRREGRLVGRYLSPYADAGWLTHAEVTMLAHLRSRRTARNWAQAERWVRREEVDERLPGQRERPRPAAVAARPRHRRGRGRRSASWCCSRRSPRTAWTSSARP